MNPQQWLFASLPAPLPLYHSILTFSPLSLLHYVLQVSAVKCTMLQRIWYMLSEQTWAFIKHLSVSLSLSAQPQSHTNTLTFLPFLPLPCWAVCHGREVRHHVILQWCVECIQLRAPRRWTTTNLTSVTGFPLHEKYIEPSARLEMACYCCPQTTSLNVTQSLLLGKLTVKHPLFSLLLLYFVLPI